MRDETTYNIKHAASLRTYTHITSDTERPCTVISGLIRKVRVRMLTCMAVVYPRKQMHTRPSLPQAHDAGMHKETNKLYGGNKLACRKSVANVCHVIVKYGHVF